VQGAEILVHARLRKSKLIDEAFLIKDAGFTVHVISEQNCPSAVQDVPLVTL